MRFIAFLAFVLCSFGAAAQDAPGRVGRVSFTEGPVSIYQDPDIGWEKAYVNSPFTSENSLWTEPGSHAEVRVSAVAIRVDGGTQLDVSRLDDEAMEASVVRGSIAIRVRHNEGTSRFAFDTPEARFTIAREGRYRIDVDPDREQVRLVVFEGEADVESAQGTRRLASGRTVVFSNGNVAYDRAQSTAIDRWAQARERDWVETRSTQYVSTYMTGYEQLDPYGQWIQEPGYGELWVPTQVNADWVPYRYGHWSYVRPWGWTWVDDQPWGYAPFHYGRWVHVRDRWAWYPGERSARPAWAPALVAFVGGTSFAVSASSGPMMGWYPLAPNEAYHPWYHASDGYVSRMNTIVIHDERGGSRRDLNGARDWNRERAITAVPRENLIERRPVQQSMVRVAQDAARNAQAVQPQAVMPSNAEIQRIRASRSRTASASVASQPAAPRGNAQGNAPASRGERAALPQSNRPGATAAAAPFAPATHPNFARARGERFAPAAPQNPALQNPAAQAPLARQPAAATPSAPSMREGRPQAPAAPQPQAPQPQPAAAPPSQGNPLRRAPEAAEQQQQRQQQEAQRQQQQQQQQEAQRRAAETQQRQQPEPQRQQEAQRRAAETQQRQQQAAQQEAQRRAAEAQQRQQQEAQRQQQQQQQAQQREAQRQQQEQQRQQRQPQPQAQPQQPQPQAQPARQPSPANPAARGEEQRAHPHGQNPEGDDKDKGGKR